jgi:C-terminal processing protease CtpA/Prc
MEQYRKLSSVVIGILLSLSTVSVFGQIENLSRGQMIQDIDTLFSTIEKVHPDMYAVYPKQLLDKDIEKLKSELESSGDIFYFYKQIAPLVVKLGDGHTGIGFPRSSLGLVPNVLLFPFPVKITYPDRVIRVQKDYTQTQNTIPIGAQITSINNRQANDIVQEMMDYASGEKDFFKTERLEYVFTPLLYTLYGDSIFAIEYLYNQNKYSVQVKGISYKERYENPQQSSSASNEPYIFSTLPDKNIGIIEFNQFTDLDRFKVFLDSTFQILKQENIGNLIIDIRKNGGGNSVLGDELLQYLSNEPFSQYGKTIVKYSDILKQFHKTYNNWEISNPNGIEIYDSEELIELRENSLRYKGNVFLLISHYTFSSATDFSWAFKYFKVGTVIGEETGGLAVCFGDIISPELPNSGLSYSISWKKFYNYGATDDNTHGTLPDYNVEAEKALEFTIDLISRRK